jgi:hypothetical protein
MHCRSRAYIIIIVIATADLCSNPRSTSPVRWHATELFLIARRSDQLTRGTGVQLVPVRAVVLVVPDCLT